MRKKRKTINLRKNLISYIIKKGFSLGDFHRKNSIMVNNTVFKKLIEFDEGYCYSFNIDTQINQIIKVYKLLQFIKEKEKPVFFFGINEFFFQEDPRNNFDFLDMNKKIFELCFSIDTSKKGEKYSQIFYNFIHKFFITFYGNYYLVNTRLNFLDSTNKFNNFFKVINNFKKSLHVRVVRHGYFFENWEGGAFSNHNVLKTNLEKSPIKKMFDKKIKFEKILLEPLLLFIRRYRTLITLDSFFKNNKNNLPGAVIFFSKLGYEHFFKEFKHLGIPVVCIVDADDCLKDIDYPLFGDSLNDEVLFFYHQIIKRALKVEIVSENARKKAFFFKNKNTLSNKVKFMGKRFPRSRNINKKKMGFFKVSA